MGQSQNWESPEQIRGKLRDKLHPFTALSDDELDTELSKIVAYAIGLDNRIYTQRAHFQFIEAEHLSSRYRFDDCYMEVRDDSMSNESKAMAFDLCVSPALVKYGTSDGRCYEIMVVIEKAQVEVGSLQNP